MRPCAIGTDRGLDPDHPELQFCTLVRRQIKPPRHVPPAAALNRRQHIVTNTFELLRTTSKTEANDLAESVYFASMMDHELAEEIVREILGIPPMYRIRVEGVDVETINNWKGSSGNLTLAP